MVMEAHTETGKMEVAYEVFPSLILPEKVKRKERCTEERKEGTEEKRNKGRKEGKRENSFNFCELNKN